MSKYEQLKIERNQLRAVLDKYSNQIHHPLYKAVRMKYDAKVRELRSMFKK